MPCYSPLKAFQCQSCKVVRFNGSKPCHGSEPNSLTLPCGQCVGCRLERSRQWAVRCSHEASLYKHNCFITLTYSPEFLPENSSLVKSHFQQFMKRLRRRFSGIEPVAQADGSMSYPIRYYMCGEYGENFGRPHYHACIFNFDFPDRVIFKITDAKSKIYTSAILSELWPFGYSSIGDVTFESAAYVARYIMKKVTGKAAESHYETVDSETGEVFDRLPEYTNMSLKPGIGFGFFQKYHTDIYPHDFVLIRGKKTRPPRFYDLKLLQSNPFTYEAIKFERADNALKYVDDNTPDRLQVKLRLKELQLKRLYRSLQ